MNPKITPEHLRRGAVVYVRQSTLGQVLEHTESQRRQYALADTARALGFATVTTIDDDLGRSGSGTVDRPGFQRLVAGVCGAAVGAVFCLEASRLARNGRDWHHLIDLCALVGTLIIDPDGVIRWVSVNDLKVGRNVKEVLRTLDALQTDELCPCNWERGEIDRIWRMLFDLESGQPG